MHIATSFNIRFCFNIPLCFSPGTVLRKLFMYLLEAGRRGVG